MQFFTISYLYSLAIVVLLLSRPCYCGGDATLSFCKNGKMGEWRERLSQVLIEVPVTVEDVYCPGIKSDKYGVSIARDFGRDVDIISQSKDMTEEDYFNVILSKLTQDRIISVSKPILPLLNGVYEAIVVLVETDSQNDGVFHQAALSSSLPNDMKVYQLSNKKFLPSHVRSQVQDDLHIWVVTGGQWSHILLNTKESRFGNLFHDLMDVFSRLHLPLKLEYRSPQSYDDYLRYGYHLFIVYHKADQLDRIHNEIIDPLVNVFRPYFAFVTFDLDQHAPPVDVSSKDTFPLVVILKHGEKSGLHINSDTIPYTTETFKNIMEEMIVPNTDDTPPHGTVITFVDIHTLEHTRDTNTVPAVAALCEKDSIDCTLIEEKMQRAVTALHKADEEYEMELYLVKCDSVEDVSIVSVPQLPYMIAKEQDNTWTLYSDSLKVTDIMRVIQMYGRSLKDVHENDSSEHSSNDYYESFPELKEDDLVALSFPEYLAIPHQLPSLTNQNYTSFIEENKNCLIAFYVPYSYSCKPMVYHILNTTEQLRQGGLYPAVANCAEYPDVCESFGVVKSPMVKYRIGFNSEWVTFKGVFSDIELLKLIRDAFSDEKHYDDTPTTGEIIELTPSLLLSLLKGDNGGLTTLLMLVSEQMTPPIQDTLSIIKNYQVYWINSTRFQKLSEFLIGLDSFEPPLLVWADYVKHSLHRLHMKDSVTKQQVLTFIDSIHNGRPRDAEILSNNWGPLSSPIRFPSDQFLDAERKQSNRNDHYDDDHYDDDHYDDGDGDGEGGVSANTHRRPHHTKREDSKNTMKEEEEGDGGHIHHEL